MRKEHYNGGLTREQFLFYEIRIAADLMLKGLPRTEIVDMIYADNLFQFPTERMIKSIANTCFKRIDALDSEELLYHLVNAGTETAKQINLYAIMCENSIVRDFMTDVIGEKYRTQELVFSQKDVNVFFMELAEKIPAANKWTDATNRKLKQVLVHFLVECGYLTNSGTQELLPVYPDPVLVDVLRARDETDVLAAFNYFM